MNTAPIKMGRILPVELALVLSQLGLASLSRAPGTWRPSCCADHQHRVGPPGDDDDDDDDDDGSTWCGLSATVAGKSESSPFPLSVYRFLAAPSLQAFAKATLVNPAPKASLGR